MFFAAKQPTDTMLVYGRSHPKGWAAQFRHHQIDQRARNLGSCPPRAICYTRRSDAARAMAQNRKRARRTEADTCFVPQSQRSWIESACGGNQKVGSSTLFGAPLSVTSHNELKTIFATNGLQLRFLQRGAWAPVGLLLAQLRGASAKVSRQNGRRVFLRSRWRTPRCIARWK